MRNFALVLVLFAAAFVPDAAAEETKNPEKQSLTDAVAELLAVFRRYPDYYGSPWHRHGSVLERSSLTGNWGGLRDKAVEKGIFLDVGVTQVVQSNVDGGRTTSGGLRYTGSADFHLGLDTAKLGLWSGGLWMIHAETSIGQPGAGGDAGVVIPPNMDGAMPRLNDAGYSALSELYLMQALSESLMVIIGKVNAAGLGDTNRFGNNERTQFMNAALVNNPILGAFAPYTPLALAVAWQINPRNALTFLLLDTNGDVGRSGFDTIFSSPDGLTYALNYERQHEIDGKAGKVAVLAGVTTKNFASFAVNPRYFLESLLGIATPVNKDSNYAIFLTFDQFFVVRDKKNGVGWGMFARAGWAPADRNAIDQFYSIGIGGKGCLIPGRDNDRWGLGWAGSHFSDDLGSILEALGRPIKSLTHVLECFYNVELTPAAHLTFDVQLILNPGAARFFGATEPVADDDHALLIGMRLQLDF